MRQVTKQNIEEMIYNFVLVYPDSLWGPGHIVLEDRNFFDTSIDFCLNLIDGVILYRQGKQDELSDDLKKQLAGLDWYYEYEDVELIETRSFLLRMKDIPEEVRETWHD